MMLHGSDAAPFFPFLSALLFVPRTVTFSADFDENSLQEEHAQGQSGTVTLMTILISHNQYIIHKYYMYSTKFTI